MISEISRTISPLTSSILPRVPWYLKWSGTVNNRWNESVVEAILSLRSESSVVDTWGLVLPNTELAERVLATIGSEIGWKRPYFIPQDQCRVVLKFWWSGISDSMELERCMWAFEKILGGRLPSAVIPEIIGMTLGELVVHFQQNPFR